MKSRLVKNEAIAVLSTMLLNSCICGEANTPVAPSGIDCNSLQPNYACSLLSPIEGSAVPGRLDRIWHSFPIRVAFITDMNASPWYNEERVQAAKEGFERWRVRSGGRVQFTYESSPAPYGAQIVVFFISRVANQGFMGYTLPQASGWYSITISADAMPSRSVLQLVCAHEMGHALGISAHSPNVLDVMSTSIVAPDVSDADVNTLRLAYNDNF